MLITNRQNKKLRCHSTSSDEEGSVSDRDVTKKPKVNLYNVSQKLMCSEKSCVFF